MWEPVESDGFKRMFKWFSKKRRRELLAMLDNLDTYLQTLRAGVKPLQVKHGFMHDEPLGVVAIDQKGGGKGLAESRLYVFPDADRQHLHLITIGLKSDQKADIDFCRQYVLDLREKRNASRAEANPNDANRETDGQDDEPGPEESPR